MPECLKFNVMGCFPSRRRASDGLSGEETSESRAGGQSSTTGIEPKCAEEGLTPTIQMVNAETLKLLQEIGELKVFQTANTDCKKNLSIHHDIMLALENPTSKGTAMPANVK